MLNVARRVSVFMLFLSVPSHLSHLHTRIVPLLQYVSVKLDKSGYLKMYLVKVNRYGCDFKQTIRPEWMLRLLDVIKLILLFLCNVLIKNSLYSIGRNTSKELIKAVTEITEICQPHIKMVQNSLQHTDHITKIRFRVPWLHVWSTKSQLYVRKPSIKKNTIPTE